MKSVGAPVSYGLDLFRNRERELERLLRLLREPSAHLVTIVGRRGIGKSSLAAKVLHDIEYGREPRTDISGIVNASTRTSGISLERLYLDCAKLVGDDAERRLLEVWTSQGSTAEKVETLLRTLGDSNYVILLDNFEDKLSDDGHLADNDLWTFLDLVFRWPGGVRLLITTQVPLALPAELRRYDNRLMLDAGLPDEEAAELLRELDRNGTAGLRDAADDDLRRAAHRVHGVPRALELLAGAMDEDLLTLPTLEDLLHTFPQRGDIVASLVQDRYWRLDQHGRLVLQILAGFGCPVGRPAVEWVVEQFAPDLDAAPVLARLARVHMVAVDRSTKSFTLHPMDADFAFGELDESRRRAMEQRIADWYALQATPESEWHTIDDVGPQRHQFGHRLRAGDYDAAARVLDTISEYLVWRGSVQAVLSMHRAVHVHLPDGPSRAAHLVGYGFAMLTAGPTDEAIGVLEQAQETTARLNAPILEAKALLWLSYAYREVRRLAESVAAAEGAGEIFRGHGRWREELRAWFSLGLSSAYQANADYALAVCDRMRALADAHDDTEGYARTFDIQAMGLLVAGRYREAISAADSAHTWYERAGIAYEKGYDHNMAGLAHLYLDEPEQAISRFETGLREAEEAQIPRLAGICLHNLAWWYWKQGDYAKAAASAHQAVDACHRSGNADMTPAAALLTACRAMLDDNAAVAAFALLEAARGVIGNADLPTSADLAAEASTLATRAGLTDLAAAAESLAKGTPPP